ncbi:MAG: GAF domain-containing protein [Candidatus Aldehydirespiratoraceae bacterium]|jgi:GAF domain-containing protein
MIGMSIGIPEPEFVRSVVTDPDRLAELRDTGLLDSGAEEPFDRITRLAEQMLDVDSARVTLVDRDRQYFTSRSDAARHDPELHETPLSHSFCQYAVASGDRFVVEDARHHQQVRENPAIADHGVVAYAGEPLATASGNVLGTLCVVSKEPRVWTDAELDVLRDLAHLALTEIEYRLRSRALQRLADVAAEIHAPADELSDAVLRLVTEAEGSDQPVVGRLAVAARSRMQKLRTVVGELDELIQWLPDVLEQSYRPASLGDRLMRAAAAASVSVGDRSLRTQIRDRPLTVRCDPLAVERALTNLLVGAMQHAAAEVPVQLAMNRIGDDVQLHLDSDGRAMPVSELSRLVGQLHSALTDPESTTTGASLQASGRAVRIGHGPITATTGPEGTHLSFTVPYVPTEN